MTTKLPIFPTVITKESFQTWSNELAAQGRLYHYEDDPSGIEDSHGYEIFTENEAIQLRQFMDRVFASDFDPMQCAVESLRYLHGIK